MNFLFLGDDYILGNKILFYFSTELVTNMYLIYLLLISVQKRIQEAYQKV